MSHEVYVYDDFYPFSTYLATHTVKSSYCLLALCLLTFHCTRVSAQKANFEIYRDSIYRIIDTARSESEKFLQYSRIHDKLSPKDTALVLAYQDTMRSFKGKVDDDFFEATYNFQLAWTLRLQRRFTEARPVIKKTIEAYKRLDSVRFAASIGRAHQMGTIIGLATQDLAFGHRQATQAIEKFRSVTGEEDNLAGTLSNLGSILMQTGLTEEALSPLRESERMYRKAKRPDRYFHPVLNQGNAHNTMGNRDSAVYHYERALAAIDEQSRPNPGQRAFVQTNLGTVYLRQGKLADARDQLESASITFEKLGAKREYASAAGNLIVVYNKLGEHRKARDIGQQALNSAAKFPEVKRKILESQITTFINLREPDSTQAYLDAFLKATNERNEAQLEKSVANAEAQFQNDLKVAEIERLELEDQVSQDRITRQKWLLIGAALILALLSFLAYGLFRQRRRIEKQKDTIAKALKEKETLLKEIHHRVKNNLQMVSSLLSLQGRYLEDDGAKAALKMGNSRVRSMALIHQKLYLTDEVNTLINARDYLEKLVTELVKNLKRPDLELALLLDVEDTELDIDRMIPLGLIVNELVTNALKYAYDGRESGRLSIKLQPEGEGHSLTVQDDGVGMPEESRTNSFGLHLVESLVDQLGGKLQRQEGKGAGLELSF
ncbi:Two-component sensor histidine kinase, contains HisKA and HATPase domains [Neolewinella agarilytica]|uniref:Two-component sensor histidine kinase, contains HisKA and HATPase domains n=1 Tax=Neolewinella agarilytica TaxID=478744 RepID=A0A1H9GLQ0_9BACT|nr:Two-component sensor histidine kinase, contains HisKA and HATPase domains [Neolewinella agarilytica]